MHGSSLTSGESGETSLVLGRLRAALPLLVAVAGIGAVVGFAGSKLQTPLFRSTATLLVVEPRSAGSGGAVDYNLTPIRSYTALVLSPAIAAQCRQGRALGERGSPRLRVRMPENTRLLEISVESPSAPAAADFANCVAARAAQENRLINERVAASTGDVARRAHDDAARQVEALAAALESGRRLAHLDLRRAELKIALGDIEAAAAEERKYDFAGSQARGRRESFGASEAARPSTRRLQAVLADDPTASAARDRSGKTATPGAAILREESDSAHDAAGRGVVEASADEAGARAGGARARSWRESATRRAAKIEEEIATLDGRLGAAGKRWEGAVSALSEIERRIAFAPLEAETKAFDLVVFAGAVASESPIRPRPPLAAAAGAAAAFAFAALYVLSAPTGRSPSSDPDSARDADA